MKRIRVIGLRGLCRRDILVWCAICAAIVALLCVSLVKRYGAKSVTVFAMPAVNKVITLDAGHGGWDPGMISKSGVQEKSINLAICEKLQTLLEESGAFVLVTRDDDSALASRKRWDLDERKNIASKGKSDLFLSIHQNSYALGGAKGPMVFYETKSIEGKRLAGALQNQLNAALMPGSKRPPTANAGYYVLKNADVPSAIIECGFLSNPQEALLLTDNEYQEKIAWAIYMGVLDYFVDNGEEEY